MMKEECVIAILWMMEEGSKRGMCYMCFHGMKEKYIMTREGCVVKGCTFVDQ